MLRMDDRLGSMADPELWASLEKLHKPNDWVHLATVGRRGEPHVAPMMMGLGDGVLLFSLTGRQKKRNLRRDPRCCVSLSRPVDLAHVIVWGTMEIRTDEAAQPMWEGMIRSAFGEEGLASQHRVLSFDGTALGVLTPRHWRIYDPGGR
jgi:general stress protein 26